MIVNDQKTSLLIPYQLPEFIRDNPDYSNFVAFIQAYYEWLEQTNNVTDRSKNILNYADIDKTSDEFLEYYINDFLPYFPEDALLDKRKAVKVAKQLYQSKGTPASYQFLFKVLYDSDFDIFYTKDSVFRASDGIWYVSKSLKLSTSDSRFLSINNYRLFGETSKSIATVENSVESGTKTEVFISNIERLFQSGEFVRVVDSNNQDVLFDGEVLRAKVVGQVSQIKIDPKNRGLFYSPGDPVIVYNGLSSNTGIGAIAQVANTTAGSIQRINTLTGGYGYTNSPNTTIDITNGGGAGAVVGSLNPAANGVANVTFAPVDTISLKRFIQIGNSNYHFSNVAISNANTTLAEAFSFVSFITYPISSVLVTSGGGGITVQPTVSASSLFPNDISSYASLSNLGILAPIQIISGGEGYEVNDTIVFSDGCGYGAYANVTNVSSNGAITSIEYVHGSSSDHDYPLGGMGYKSTQLPTTTVSSANVLASGAVLSIPGILGEGASFSAVTDRAGSISTISLIQNGEDYIETPNVSIKVQDIIVSNVSVTNLPEKMDVVYQGDNINVASYKATVNSIVLLAADADPLKSTYNFRVFNYSSTPNPGLTLKVDNKNINYQFANVAPDSSYSASGIKNYGDGTAKATATFLNGLVLGEGQYLNTQGQPSSFNVLQSQKYNNYTYMITVRKEIAKYRDILLNLLHPSGMKMLGRYKIMNQGQVGTTLMDQIALGQPLSYYTGNPGSYVTMTTDFVNKGNNIVVFGGLSGANIADFIFVDSPGISNTILEITPTNGPNVRSEVIRIDSVNNQVILKESTWLTFPNVAHITATAGTNEINIESITNSYNVINNGQYVDSAYPIRDIVYVGDTILVANNDVMTVDEVDYENNIIYTSNNFSNDASSLMTVRRTFETTQVKVLGQIGTASYPALATDDGTIITTEDDAYILIG